MTYASDVGNRMESLPPHTGDLVFEAFGARVLQVQRAARSCEKLCRAKAQHLAEEA